MWVFHACMENLLRSNVVVRCQNLPEYVLVSRVSLCIMHRGIISFETITFSPLCIFVCFCIPYKLGMDTRVRKFFESEQLVLYFYMYSSSA